MKYKYKILKKKNFFIALIPLVIFGASFSFSEKKINKNNQIETNSNFIKQEIGLENPYIITNGFEINNVDLLTSSVIFTITTIGEWIAPEEIDISLLINNDAESPQSYTATKLDTSSHIVDSGINEIQYHYQITELDTTQSYTFYSLNNTGLAVENNGDALDEEILLADDLGMITSDISFNFDGNDNSYIQTGSFNIEKVSNDIIDFSFIVSSNWAIQDYFEISVLDWTSDNEISNIFNIDVNLNSFEDLENGFIEFTYEINSENSDFIKNNEDHYQINEFLNTYLAVDSSTNEINNDIYLSGNLGVAREDATFYLESPYIQGFQILSISDNSVEFEINVINNQYKSFIPEEGLEITIKDLSNQNNYQTNAIYLSDKSSEENGDFVYKISNLDSSSDYKIISIDNSWLAVDDAYQPIDDEILLEDDLGISSDDSSFKTGEDKVETYLIIIAVILVIIILILLIILLFMYFKKNKNEKEINKLSNKNAQSSKNKNN